MGNEPEDPDPATFIVAVVFLAILTLVLLRFCDYLCKRGRKSEDDTEQLVDGNVGCCNGITIFSCCSDTGTEPSVTSGVALPPTQDQDPPPPYVPPETDAAVATLPHQRTIDLSSLNIALTYLQRQQQSEAQTDTSTSKVTRVRLVQNLLQLDKANKPTEENVQAALIIGVDATPKVLGGYCVNLREHRLEYYVIKADDFPWDIEKPNDSSEFEIKNLQFALAVWSDVIKRLKTFRVYTDNNAVKGSSEVGMDAQILLKHLTKCEGATLVNGEQIYVNRMQDLADFAKYIQPADDLSRWQIDKGVDFLCKFYGIHKNRAKGTVKLTVRFTKLEKI